MIDERRKLIACMLDIGKAMLKSGAEISRVEDTLMRIGKSYGAKRVNAFALASIILVSIEFIDGEEITRTRRIRKGLQNDFSRLEEFNELSRKFCSGKISIDDMSSEILRIMSKTPSKLLIYSGNALASGAFAMFFGGNIFDALVSALFGLLICFLQYRFTPLCRNSLTFVFIASFFTGLGILFLSELIPVLNADKIMIGDIMLLVPGIAITISVRDIFVGDTITGSMRFVESILSAVALAAGFILAILTVGGVL